MADIVGHNVILAGLRESDRAPLFAWINDPDLMKWNAPFRVVSSAEHDSWFNTITQRDDVFIRSIRNRDDNNLLGLVQLVGIDMRHLCAEMRIKLCAPASTDRGIGSEALSILLDYAWQQLNLERIEARVFSGNVRAITAYRKVGFSEEGLLQHAAKFEDGWRDIVVMAALHPQNKDAAIKWRDFTEAAYRELIRNAKAGGYAFVGYDSLPSAPSRHVVWRHDVDFSMHRALALAQIEADEGVRSTFFLNPHSTFYNLLEPEIMVLTRQIRELGHTIGLHFDADAFPGEVWTTVRLEANLTTARQLLETIIGHPVGTYSYHNPDVGNLLAFDTDMAGMVNAYNRNFRQAYGYASDSNGYWRFKPISELIRDGLEDRLHILTHPGWWMLDPMPPRDRIARAAQGRAARAMAAYDAFLHEKKRYNVRK